MGNETANPGKDQGSQGQGSDKDRTGKAQDDKGEGKSKGPEPGDGHKKQ